MDFGYFTLSDNRYPVNPRTPEQFVKEIYDQALWAEEVGMNSAWIGEHHFNLLGVNCCPNITLAQIAGATKRIRLAPAVVLLPVHHPLHVAEEWATLDLLSGGRVDFAAGRGYDVKEYLPYQVSFHDSAEIFAEGLEVLHRAWHEEGVWSHKGKHYQFENIEVRPRPMQNPFLPIVACFSKVSMEMAAKNGWPIIYAPFAAAMVYGSLANAVQAYRDECVKFGTTPKSTRCSYFVHIVDNPEEDAYARERLLSYFKDALVGSFPSDPKTAPPTLQYFIKIVEILNNMQPGDLTSRSVLLGSPQQIIDDLKDIEKSGISEVILYFNYGMKPHQMVKDQMQRFMEEVAPAFDGAHKQLVAAE